MEFLGLGLENNIPDRTTFWLFKQELLKQELITELFEKFESYLQKSGHEALTFPVKSEIPASCLLIPLAVKKTTGIV